MQNDSNTSQEQHKISLVSTQTRNSNNIMFFVKLNVVINVSFILITKLLYLGTLPQLIMVNQDKENILHNYHQITFYTFRWMFIHINMSLNTHLENHGCSYRAYQPVTMKYWAALVLSLHLSHFLRGTWYDKSIMSVQNIMSTK